MVDDYRRVIARALDDPASATRRRRSCRRILRDTAPTASFDALLDPFGLPAEPWSRTLTIRLNGETRTSSPAPSLIERPARRHWIIDARRVAVEHNLVVVKRDDYSTIDAHRDGDEVEIVNFVGGGYSLDPRIRARTRAA